MALHYQLKKSELFWNKRFLLWPFTYDLRRYATCVHTSNFCKQDRKENWMRLLLCKLIFYSGSLHLKKVRKANEKKPKFKPFQNGRKSVLQVEEKWSILYNGQRTFKCYIFCHNLTLVVFSKCTIGCHTLRRRYYVKYMKK